MKTKQETNIIGMMLLALVFFLLIGMAIEIALEGRTVGIDEITGAVSGMEKVSGFAEATWSAGTTWTGPSGKNYLATPTRGVWKIGNKLYNDKGLSVNQDGTKYFRPNGAVTPYASQAEASPDESDFTSNEYGYSEFSPSPEIKIPEVIAKLGGGVEVKTFVYNYKTYTIYQESTKIVGPDNTHFKKDNNGAWFYDKNEDEIKNDKDEIFMHPNFGNAAQKTESVTIEAQPAQPAQPAPAAGASPPPGASPPAPAQPIPEPDPQAQQKLAEEVLKKQIKGAKKIGLDENDRQVARKGKEFFVFNGKDKYDKITTETFILREKISDDTWIDKTYDTPTGKLTSITATDSNNYEATIDNEILEQIKLTKGRDFEVTQLGDVNTNEDQILEFTDSGGRKVRVKTNPGFTLTDGTKTTEILETVYFYNSEIITKEQYDKLEKEGKEPKSLEIISSSETKTIEKGKGKSFTTSLDKSIKFDTAGNLIYISEQAKYDSDTGNFIGFIYKKKSLDQDLTVTLDANGGCTGDCDKLKSDAESAQTAFKSRQIFGWIESALTSFRGLGFYSTFFFSDEELEEWRESVDRLFAENYLGVEYWKSAVCAQNMDRDNEGVAYVDTKLGLAAVAAHIEASRSHAAELPPGLNATQEFLYKVTFNVKNGDWDKDPSALEKMRFNVQFRGERTVIVFKENIELDKGKTFARIGASAIVKYSRFKYSEICLVFDKVPSSWSLDSNELCNKIQSPSKIPTRIEIERAGQQIQPTEEEINDF